MNIPEIDHEKILIERYGKVILERYFSDPDGETRDFLLWGGKTPPVIVLPLTPEKKVIALLQFRRGANECILEIPGGGTNPKEDILVSAGRELTEETGYVADKLTKLGKPIWLDPASCFTPFMPVLATDCKKDGEQKLDETEKMEIGGLLLIDWTDWLKMIYEGDICDSKTIAVTFLAQRYVC